MANKISHNDIAQAIYQSIKGKSGQSLKEILEQVTQFLYRKRLLSQKEGILTALRKIINKEDGVVDVKVSSATRLTGKLRVELTHFLKKKYKAEEVLLEEMVDELLLGGIKVEVDDEVLDLTIKNKIGQLQAYLAKI